MKNAGLIFLIVVNVINVILFLIPNKQTYAEYMAKKAARYQAAMEHAEVVSDTVNQVINL